MRASVQTPSEYRTRVVVVGAGQAGLSVAYYLQRLGLDMQQDVVVVDRGPSTGGAWQFRWEALRLGTAHRVHDLPGMPEMGLRFDDADRSRPARDVVEEYYRRYEDHYGLHVRRPVDVVGVRNHGLDLAVTLRGAPGHTVDLVTEIVVNATGTWGSPFVPWYAGRDAFRGRQVDTTQYRAASEFANQDVVVVGGGTTAVGFLLELENVAASTYWCARRPIDWLDHGELDLESATEAVAKQDAAARIGNALPSIVSGTGIPRSRRIQAGIERGVLDPHPMFSRIEPDGVVLPDGTFHHADAIIWATGFRPELRHLAPLRLRERSGGMLVGKGASWKDPRVYFAGYGPQASTIGANRAGRTIARQVVAALSRH
jgi:cation diffusion facilitator CzcD-associated flavoprotein CzcO